MKNPKERFFAKVNRDGDCWLWQSSTAGNGYAKFFFNGKSHLAHRLSYAWFIGNIPDGMDICHKCDVRNCVNPAHLFVGTRSDNMRDCSAKGRIFTPRHNADKTHCPRGHEYTLSNTWTDKKGWRFCRACNRAKANARNQNKASAKTAAL